MKTIKLLICTLFMLLTFNLYAQHEYQEGYAEVSENSVIKNMTICLTTPGWNGILKIYLDGQPLYHGYWGDGYLMEQSTRHMHFTSQIDVYLGAKIEIWAELLGMGRTNIVEVTVNELPRDPSREGFLTIMQVSSRNDIAAYINNY